MTTDVDNSASANVDVNKLQAALFAVHDQLQSKFNATTDPDMSEAILTEMQEVMHRIVLLQRQIFVGQSSKLSNLADQVDGVNQTLQQSLQTINQITDLVKAVAN